MNKDSPVDFILRSTGAKSIKESQQLQRLWSGYGSIWRYFLVGSEMSSVVVKNVRVPVEIDHPRGWSGVLGHKRKLRSYQVEHEWYRSWSLKLGKGCYVPKCYGLEADDSGENLTIVLEDLSSSGFTETPSSVSIKEVKVCLSWLARFHATFMGCEPNGLWRVGTYWHLETRPDELDALTDLELKEAAIEIDSRLSASHFKTIVHGDSKLDNFCFSTDKESVATVDFQYVGGGCGMKDVAYFIGSCLSEQDCEALEDELLDFYFDIMGRCIDRAKFDFKAVQDEWRELSPYAWADFHRFLRGWSPGHWKINSYSERLTRKVLESL